MVRPWCWVVLLNSAVLALAHGAFDARPLVTVYSSEDIGQDAMSWITVEDRDHGLHFGANELISFDGTRWRSDPATHAFALRGLDVDSNGRIWAAANGQIGWFDRRGDGGWAFHSLVEHLPASERDLGDMWQAYAIPGGAVFAGANALYWWSGSSMVVQRFPGPRRMAAMRCSSGIYVCQASTGLWRADRFGKTQVVPPEQLGGATVLWAEDQIPSGRLLLATSRGFWSAQQGRIAPVFPEVAALLREWVLAAVLRLPDARLALGTLRGGILILDNQGRVLERFNRQNGLPTDEIFSLHADHEGGLWATSSANLFRVSLLGARWYRDTAGTGDEPCVAIAHSGDHLLFATDHSILRADARGEHLVAVGGRGRHYWSLESAGPSALIGRDGGLDLLAGDTVQSVFEGASDVSAIKVERSGRTALVASGQGIWRVSWRKPAAPALIARVPEPAATLAQGAAGDLWAGTIARGILHGVITNGEPPLLKPASFARGTGTGSVAEAADGTVYAFAEKAGWRISPTQRVESIRNFPRREVCATACGPGGIWIAHPADGMTGACIAEIRTEGGVARWVPRLIEGLWRVGIPEALLAENSSGRSRLWIGGTAGILRCDLDSLPRPAALPRPLMTVRGRDGGPVLPDQHLPYSARELVLTAEVNSYALRPALILESKIAPVDRDWLPLDAAGGRPLIALRDGKYVLRTRLRASTGELSPEAEQTMVILPPWWRTVPALALLGLLMGAVAYGLHRWNSRALRRRAEHLERTVLGRTREVEAANAEKTRFVAGISHDIRNPLNGIVGLTLALEDSELSARQRELTRAMRGCAKYLDGLVDEVIDFAQIESGHAAVRPEWYDVHELLDDVVAITRADAEIGEARVVAEVAPGLPNRLWGDVARIRQILVNLTFNAIRHAGGKIELKASRAQAEGGEAVDFSVVDSGPGIAPSDQMRLFEPFSRIEGGRSRRTAGSGLGLATSKRWAQAMDGRIRVSSVVGHGCRFVLSLPVSGAPAPCAGDATECRLRRVMVVEDEDYNAWAIAAVAARVGVTVIARASTGAEALRLFAPGRFDGILLDRLLPDMDGTKVARSIRASGDTVVKIIALTAGATAEDRAACLAAGMDAFIGKPLTPDKLLNALNQMAAPHESREAAFDLRLISFLADGTAEGRAAQLTRYRSHLAELHAALTVALVSADPDATRECAHRLHGHLRMVEAQASGLVAAIEQAAKKAQLPSVQRVEELNAAIGRLEELLSGADVPPQTLEPAHRPEAPRQT
jgi:signal transduction histidine kinase/CheY-like chemotaxis protein